MRSRKVGGRTLVVDDAGRWSWDSLPPADVDALARAAAARGVAAWDGPAAHILLLDGMELETVKLAVDFAFDSSSPALSLELVSESWRPLWFAVQYARRRSEWSRRRLLLTARTAGHWEFLKAHGVVRRAVLDKPEAVASTDPLKPTPDRVLARVGPGAKAGEWVSALKGAGSVLFTPVEDWRGFLDFYDEALGLMLEDGPRDEWAMHFLAARPWALPGVDVLGELAYDGDGSVYTSERKLIKLGTLGELRFRDLRESELVRSVISVELADAQPQCSTCAYRAYCSLGASAHLLEKKTLWGHLPTSAACALHMGVLDRLFARLTSEKSLSTLHNWNIDIL